MSCKKETDLVYIGVAPCGYENVDFEIEFDINGVNICGDVISWADIEKAKSLIFPAQSNTDKPEVHAYNLVKFSEMVGDKL